MYCLAKILKYRILYSSCKEKCSIQCVQKCFAFFQLTGVSLLSNSKWKGCCLKVQAAKESFLTRYRYMFQIVKSLITSAVFFMQGCGEYFCFISVLLHYSPAAYAGIWAMSPKSTLRHFNICQSFLILGSKFCSWQLSGLFTPNTVDSR